MKDEKEKLEIKKKPQDVKKEDLDKVAGGDFFKCSPTQELSLGGVWKCSNTSLC